MPSVGAEAARLATIDDLPAIDRVWTAVNAAVQEHRGGALFLRRESGGAAMDRARELVDHSDGLVVVGTYDGVVLGYGIGAVESLDDGGLLGRIDDLVVEAEAREVGIGESIMNLLIGEFRARGCFGVDSRALPGDRHTKNFFESFGLKARLLVVHRELD